MSIPQYDDYSKPIKFDTEENDQRFTDILIESDVFFELDDFYGVYFDVTDNLIITNSNEVITIDGPFVTQTNLDIPNSESE